MEREHSMEKEHSTDKYVSPLSERYASRQMQYIFPFSPSRESNSGRQAWQQHIYPHLEDLPLIFLEERTESKDIFRSEERRVGKECRL